MQRVTIKDIARECEVSLSTVSLVLNGNPRISEATRAKVMAVVDKYDYQPNINARGLASRSSHTIGVVVPNLNHVFADVYFGEIVSGIYERACANGYRVMLDIANERFLEQREYINLLRSRRVDGMLVVGSTIADRFPREMVDYTYPFLMVNHYLPDAPIDYVTFDYIDSALKAAALLIARGHRRIGLIAGTNTFTGLDFKTTFLEACSKDGAETVWEDGGPAWSQEGGYEAARRLLERDPSITAIMAANDRLAIGALAHLKKAKRRVPEEVSVMGMDDIRQAAFSDPPLTTIRHDLYRMGETCFDRVVALFRKEIDACREVMPVSVVERESVGPAPSV